jgi:hypothetical protein
LAAGSGAKIRLTYVTELKVEGGEIRFYLPTTIAPRYVPPTDHSSVAKDLAGINYTPLVTASNSRNSKSFFRKMFSFSFFKKGILNIKSILMPRCEWDQPSKKYAPQHTKSLSVTMQSTR